jgi:hypothetical protein
MTLDDIATELLYRGGIQAALVLGGEGRAFDELIVAVLYTAMMNTRSSECSEGAKELLAERVEVAVTRSGEAPFDAVRVHENPKVSGVGPSGDNNRKVKVKKVVRFAVGNDNIGNVSNADDTAMWCIVVIDGTSAFSKDGGLSSTTCRSVAAPAASLSELKCTTLSASQLLGLGRKMTPAEKRKQQEIKNDASAWQSSRDKASAEQEHEKLALAAAIVESAKVAKIVKGVTTAKKRAKLKVPRERKNAEAQSPRLLSEAEGLVAGAVGAAVVELTLARPEEQCTQQVSGSLSDSTKAEPQARRFHSPSFTAATMLIAGCVVALVVSFTASTTSLFWDCGAACVVQAHDKRSAGGYVSTPASTSLDNFAPYCSAEFNQSSYLGACSFGSAVAAAERGPFIEPWVNQFDDIYTSDLVSPELADFAGAVATSLFASATGTISSVFTMTSSLLCSLWTWECMLLPLVVFGCYFLVCTLVPRYSRPVTKFTGLRMRRLLARRARDTGDPRALRGLCLMADDGDVDARLTLRNIRMYSSSLRALWTLMVFSLFLKRPNSSMHSA